jgi:hypothetical protein
MRSGWRVTGASVENTGQIISSLSTEKSKNLIERALNCELADFASAQFLIAPFIA